MVKILVRQEEVSRLRCSARGDRVLGRPEVRVPGPRGSEVRGSGSSRWCSERQSHEVGEVGVFGPG